MNPYPLPVNYQFIQCMNVSSFLSTERITSAFYNDGECKLIVFYKPLFHLI